MALAAEAWRNEVQTAVLACLLGSSDLVTPVSITYKTPLQAITSPVRPIKKANLLRSPELPSSLEEAEGGFELRRIRVTLSKRRSVWRYSNLLWELQYPFCPCCIGFRSTQRHVSGIFWVSDT